MSIEGKVAEMIMGLIKLKSVELDDLFRFSEAIVQLVKLEVKKDDSLMVKEFTKLPVNEMWYQREPTVEELTELWEIAKKECISCEGRLLKSGVIIFRRKQ